MPLMDEFQDERNQILKNGTLKEKAAYLWCYYKWHAFAVIVVTWVVVSVIVAIVTHKDPAFYSVVVNGSSITDDDAFAAGFAELIDIDASKEEVVIEPNMYMDWNIMDDMTAATTQKIAVYVSAGDVDVIQSDLSAMNYYAYNNIITDLREYLRDDQLEKYESYIFYADKTIIDEKKAADEAKDYTYEISYPADPYDPSTMKDPIPVAINLRECTNFINYYYFKADILFGVFKTSTRKDDCAVYLDYIASRP